MIFLPDILDFCVLDKCSFFFNYPGQNVFRLVGKTCEVAKANIKKTSDSSQDGIVVFAAEIYGPGGGGG